MRQRGFDLAPWFGMLALSLGLAYWASLPTVDKATIKVDIVSITAAKIGSMELSAADSKVTAVRRKDHADKWWITYERSAQPAAADGAVAGPDSERFMASAKFGELLERLAPLQALRVIGKVGSEQLKEFGLSEQPKRLVVKDSQGKPLLSLLVGKQLYGSRNYYVLDQSDEKVLLISGDLISDFEKPELRVFERLVTSIAPDDIQSALVTTPSGSRKFGHTRRDSKGQLVWTAEDGQEGDVPQAGSWFEKFLQLKAAVYATEAEEAALAAVPAIFEVRIDGAGAAQETIQVRKRPQGPSFEYWLTSSYLKWHVKIASTRAEILEKDLPQIIGGA